MFRGGERRLLSQLLEQSSKLLMIGLAKIKVENEVPGPKKSPLHPYLS